MQVVVYSLDVLLLQFSRNANLWRATSCGAAHRRRYVVNGMLFFTFLGLIHNSIFLRSHSKLALLSAFLIRSFIENTSYVGQLKINQVFQQHWAAVSFSDLQLPGVYNKVIMAPP